jgi:hypothetical protein
MTRFQQIGRSSLIGAVAQLVEHIPFKDGVNGSNPFRATISTIDASKVPIV